ncbi:uncharacterized protein EDB91DRAFT_1189731, partial [Suillus paluster]|uniref:uncharacterized protein n=1 Tax=Suillus paluster TaxID=48578 RepID=UPI001B886A07
MVMKRIQACWASVCMISSVSATSVSDSAQKELKNYTIAPPMRSTCIESGIATWCRRRDLVPIYVLDRCTKIIVKCVS